MPADAFVALFSESAARALVTVAGRRRASRLVELAERHGVPLTPLGATGGDALVGRGPVRGAARRAPRRLDARRCRPRWADPSWSRRIPRRSDGRDDRLGVRVRQLRLPHGRPGDAAHACGSGWAPARRARSGADEPPTAPGPPSAASSAPASTGASGIADIATNRIADWHPALQPRRRERHPVGADAGVAGRVEEASRADERSGDHDAGRSRTPSAPPAARSSTRSAPSAGRCANRSISHGAAMAPSMPKTPGGGLDQADLRRGSKPLLDQPQHRHEEQRVDGQVGQRATRPAGPGRTAGER